MKDTWRESIRRQRAAFAEPSYEAWRCAKCHRHINPLDIYELTASLQPICDTCHAKARLAELPPLDKLYSG